MTAVRGLDNIVNGGTQFITFEEGKPMTLLFLDWYEDLIGIREHYEPSLNPKYIRCPGREVCPLCAANPGKYPSLKIKFRVFDPSDEKVKFVSLAKTHIQKLNNEFNLEEVDPTKNFVVIYRSGKTASDTSYSTRAYRPNPEQGKPELQIPNFEAMGIEVPTIDEQVTPHTPEQIQGFMNALLAGAHMPPQQDQGQFQGQYQQQQGQGFQQQGQYQQGQQQYQQQGQYTQQGQQQDQGQQQGQYQQQQDQGQYQQPQGFQQQGQFQGQQQGGFPPANQGQQGAPNGRKLPF